MSANGVVGYDMVSACGREPAHRWASAARSVPPLWPGISSALRSSGMQVGTSASNQGKCQVKC